MRDYIDKPNLKVRGARSEKSTRDLLRRPLILALAFCLLAGLLLWFDLGGQFTPVRRVVGEVLTPVAQPVVAIRDGVTGLWAGATELQRLRAENETLREENSQLQTDLIDSEAALVENERLREQLAIQEQHPWRLVGADVIMRSPDAGRRTITIARGSDDGIDVGMAVVGRTSGGPVALIGMVDQVGSRAATVLLTTDLASRVSARVLYRGHTALGLVQGQWQHGSRLRLEEVAYHDALAEEAIVVTAGLTGELDLPLPLAAVPAGVPIGAVETVVSEGPDTYAELRPYADPDQVRYVWVILSHDD
jgi:rod shape-determining protein MreC